MVITYVPWISHRPARPRLRASSRRGRRSQSAPPRRAPARRHQGPGAGPADRGPVLHPAARRIRRRGDQDRAAGRGRPAAPAGATSRTARRCGGTCSRAASSRWRSTCGSPRARRSRARWRPRPTSWSRISVPARWKAGGWATTRSRGANPGLVMVRISGYGQTGPYRERPGFGVIGEAVGGLRHVTGTPDRPPSRVGVSIGDTLSALYGVIGALMALQARASHRSRPGRRRRALRGGVLGDGVDAARVRRASASSASAPGRSCPASRRRRRIAATTAATC